MVVAGPDELAEGQATVKDLASGTQERIAIEEIADHIKNAINSKR